MGFESDWRMEYLFPHTMFPFCGSSSLLLYQYCLILTAAFLLNCPYLVFEFQTNPPPWSKIRILQASLLLCLSLDLLCCYCHHMRIWAFWQGCSHLGTCAIAELLGKFGFWTLLEIHLFGTDTDEPGPSDIFTEIALGHLLWSKWDSEEGRDGMSDWDGKFVNIQIR